MRGHAATLFWVFAIGGCGKVADTSDITPDANIEVPPADAGVAIDAAPPCTGGDGQVVDPDTGACFIVFRTARTRADAQATCTSLGGQLASARSAAQNTLITKLIGASQAFLGGNDIAAEGDFRWADGAPLTFKNWRTNEPNNGMGQHQEDCLIIVGQTGGVWDDKPCDSSQVATEGKYQFVCERS